MSNINKHIAMKRWKVLISATLIQSIICGVIESYGALLLPMMDLLEKAKESQKTVKAALIGSLASGCLMGFSPLSGFLADTLGVINIAIMGGIICFFATFMASFAETFFSIVITYGFLLGLGASLLFIANGIIVSQQFVENNVIPFAILGFGNGVTNAIMPHIMVYAVQIIKINGTIRTISLVLIPTIFLPFFWTEKKDQDFKEIDSIDEDQTEFDQKSGVEFSQLWKRQFIPDVVVKRKNKKTNVSLFNKRIENRIWIDEKVMNNFNSFQNNYCSSEYQCLSHKDRIENSFSHRILLRDISDNDMVVINSYYSQANQSNKKQSKSSKTSIPKSPLSSLIKTKDDDSRNFEFLDLSFNSNRDNLRFNFQNYMSVLQNKGFLHLCIAMDLAYLGYQVPNIHIINFSKSIQAQGNAQLLLTCLGGASALGPLINPFFISKFEGSISKFRIYQMFVLGYGIAVIFLPLVNNFLLLMFICTLIGYFDGSFSTLVGPIVLDFIGNNNASLALGLYYGSVALPICVAAPLAGYIFDAVHSYNVAFYVAGIFFLIGGFCLSFIQTKTELDSDLALNTDSATVSSKKKSA